MRNTAVYFSLFRYKLENSTRSAWGHLLLCHWTVPSFLHLYFNTEIQSFSIGNLLKVHNPVLFKREILFIFIKKGVYKTDKPCYTITRSRGISAVGSAQHWQCWGQEFESPMLHQMKTLESQRLERFSFCLLLSAGWALTVILTVTSIF